MPLIGARDDPGTSSSPAGSDAPPTVCGALPQGTDLARSAHVEPSSTLAHTPDISSQFGAAPPNTTISRPAASASGPLRGAYAERPSCCTQVALPSLLCGALFLAAWARHMIGPLRCLLLPLLLLVGDMGAHVDARRDCLGQK